MMKDILAGIITGALCVSVFITSCGVFIPYEKTPTKIVIVNGKTPLEGRSIQPYSFQEIQKTCTSCHNNSAPLIPLDESGFYSSPKVKSRILDGTMPPAGGLNLERASKYFEG